MSIKYIDNPLPYGPSSWHWPENDFKSFNIFETVYEIDEWIDLCKGRECAVQAGANMGIWPLRMSQLFSQVISFEPNPIVYDCAVNNVYPFASNVKIYNRALSDVEKMVHVELVKGNEGNYGAGYIVDGGDVQAMRIDDLYLENCDLLCLDIEGAELDALKGAEETIKEYRPLVVVEDKPMQHMTLFNRNVGAMGGWLSQFGYKKVGRVHWDDIYAC